MNFEDAVQELLADQLGSWIGLIDLKTIIGARGGVKSNQTQCFRIIAFSTSKDFSIH